ncbi:hypothetical protein CO151_11245 [bacterium CG_4_9_14_3_um_filter_65_15]|nr:MAG: hypothetical protein CO151_11245 [bacterium CG_4_9_14_3_um_filter_65_15]
MTRLLRVNDEDIAVTVRGEGGAYRVAVAGRDLPWAVRPEGEDWVIDTPTGRLRFAALVTPDACHVFREGKVRSFAKPDPDLDEAGCAGGAGPLLVAEMPGKVVKVMVGLGDEVAVGQPLVIMESMKMETELSAAVSGRVAQVAVEAGQVVGQGDLLVEIEVAGEDS